MNREVYISSAAEFVPMAVGIFAALAPRTVALSGGSTPAPIYRRLAALRYPWDSVDVFFGDERCVPPDDKDSNFRMANAALLSAVPARAHPMNGVRGDADGYANELTATFGAAMPRFDLVFLGLRGGRPHRVALSRVTGARRADADGRQSATAGSCPADADLAGIKRCAELALPRRWRRKARCTSRFCSAMLIFPPRGCTRTASSCLRMRLPRLPSDTPAKTRKSSDRK